MRKVLLLAVLLLVSVTSVLRAQSTNASLTGRITDPSQALIVDAKVTAINVGINFVYETKTNSAANIIWRIFRPIPTASKSKNPASRS